MIDQGQAREIAMKWLKASPAEGPDGPLACRILDEHTIETDFGWVFFYESERSLQTAKFSEKLAGNAPVIIDRRDGAVHVTGTAQPIEHYIERYRGARPLG